MLWCSKRCKIEKMGDMTTRNQKFGSRFYKFARKILKLFFILNQILRGKQGAAYFHRTKYGACILELIENTRLLRWNWFLWKRKKYCLIQNRITELEICFTFILSSSYRIMCGLNRSNTRKIVSVIEMILTSLGSTCRTTGWSFWLGKINRIQWIILLKLFSERWRETDLFLGCHCVDSLAIL